MYIRRVLIGHKEENRPILINRAVSFYGLFMIPNRQKIKFHSAEMVGI